MNTTQRFTTRLGLGAAAVAMAIALGAPAPASANTAANTAILNTATVNYKDAGGTAQTPVTASATVTVSLVPATPTLNAPADQNATLATAASYSYTITTNANGPDTYNIAVPSKVNSANITASSAVPSVTPISLGASTIVTPVTILAAGTTAITVPSDGVAGGGVNGLIAAETVVINGQTYTIASVVDNASGTSTVTVNGNGVASAALPYGTLIAEQKTFTLDVKPTTMNPTTTNETITTTVSARDSGNIAAAATDVTVTTVQAANLTVTKEVSTDGVTWGATANAAPGATLYYRITVHNGGAGNATAVVISDPINSLTYLTYTAGSAKKATGAAVSYAAAPTALTDASAVDDGYDWNVTTAGTVTYTAGTIASGAANDVQLFFKVTIK